jgi:hypothetical protein
VGLGREKQVVITMSYNYSQSFRNAVSRISGGGGTSGGSTGSNFFGSKPSTATVKDASNTGVFGFLSGIFGSEKHVHTEPHGSNKASVTVKDYTGASAGQILTGNVPEQRYNATQVGNEVIVEKAPSAGDSWWKILTGK